MNEAEFRAFWRDVASAILMVVGFVVLWFAFGLIYLLAFIAFPGFLG